MTTDPLSDENVAFAPVGVNDHAHIRRPKTPGEQRPPLGTRRSTGPTPVGISDGRGFFANGLAGGREGR